MEGEQRRTKGLSKPCIMLIVIAGKERFAFKGVASNLVTYLTDVVKMSNSSAAKTVNNWCGLTSIMPLLLAPLADSYWDRYSTIISFSIIYVLGLVALTSTAFAWSPTTSISSISSSAFLYLSLCLISLGQGGYNPSLQAFGADQLDNDEDLPSSKDTQKPNKKSVFFTWWYFGVCSGSLLGVTVMSYIQDTYGWVLGFAIPTVVMVISTVFFACGSRIYTYKSDEKTEAEPPFPSIVGAIKAAASKLNMSSKTKLPKEEEEADLVELELQQKPLCQQNLASGNKDLDEDQISKKRNYLAENAKLVIRLLPIWTMLLMFAVIFQQPSTFFTKQGMTMKRNIGSSFKIPPATLQSSITVSIILLMPLYDTVLIPIMQKITRNEKGISVMQRMGVGMFLSIIAMVIAAKVETKRIEMSKQMGNNSLDSEPDQTVPLSIFCLLPQYILLGISDIFTVVGMQEFFYNEVPVRMRTMAFALYTSVFGVGSFMSALFITLIEAFTCSRGSKHGWFSDDMREARIDKYYWLLAMTSALSFLLYLILCRFFKSRTALDSENCQ